MARLARVVAPGAPHHITQRGNRRMPTFFSERDYREYIRLLSHWCETFSVEVWAYCLMPNHVHLIAVPEDARGLRRAIGEAHRRYTLMVNLREGWSGHLWQGRFFSFPLDARHLFAAVRYVEMNPVRAGLVGDPTHWPWSSALAHVRQEDDALVNTAPLCGMIGGWGEFLSTAMDPADLRKMRAHARTGRPLGEGGFVDRLEKSLNRPLKPGRRGPKVRIANQKNEIV